MANREANHLHNNDGDGTFTESGASAGVDDSGDANATWGDFDNDGLLDLYLTRAPGNGSDSVNQLYRNNGGVNHSLAVELLGTASNRAGIGARVVASVGGETLRRDVSGGGVFQSQPSLPVELGLDRNTGADEFTVYWPSGIEQTLMNVPAGAKLVVEPLMVMLPDTVATYNEPLQIPVRIVRTDGLEIVSAEIFVAYDGDLLTAWSSPVTATAMTADWTIEVNDVEGIGTPMDTLKIAMADEAGLGGSGDLLLLNFTVADVRHPASSSLDLAHVLLNDGTPGNEAVDGLVTLVGVDGEIVSLPSEILPRWSVGVSVYEADEDRTGARDAFDVAIANGGQTEVLTVVETGSTSGVFSGSIGTEFSLSSNSGDGIVQAQAGDAIEFCYDDLLDAVGSTVVRCDTTQVIGGADGTLDATVVSQPGDTVRVRVADADLSESVSVSVVNPRTGESESILLSQFSAGSSIFYGRFFTGTTAGTGDSALAVQKEDVLSIVYADTLTALGGTAAQEKGNQVVDPFGDTMLPPIPPFDGRPADGIPGAIDAFAVLYHRLHPYIAGFDSLSVNVDLQAPLSEIDPWDAALILKKVVGSIDRFPVQTPQAANQPQPETATRPRLIPEERRLALEAGEGYLSVWADEREGIFSGDFLLAGVEEGRAAMAAELGDFLSVYQAGAEGMRIVFAGAEAASGPGELLRVYGAGSGGARLVRASLNGGRIEVRLDGLELSARPASFALHANAPNPFNPETAIHFDLPTAAQVRLEVFDALGQRVRVLVGAPLPAGAHRAVWDGRDAAGAPVGSGVYFYRLQARAEAASFAQVRRMILLK